jgi:plastocyanin
MGVRRIILSVLAVSVTACGSTKSATAPSPTPAGVAVSIPVGARSSSGAGGFAPNPITVPVGTTVTWTNNDTTAAHDVASDTGLWNSNSMAAGAQFSFVFQTKGTFPYHCTVHSGMIGTVTVQ